MLVKAGLRVEHEQAEELQVKKTVDNCARLSELLNNSLSILYFVFCAFQLFIDFCTLFFFLPSVLRICRIWYGTIPFAQLS